MAFLASGVELSRSHLTWWVAIKRFNQSGSYRISNLPIANPFPTLFRNRRKEKDRERCLMETVKRDQWYQGEASRRERFRGWGFQKGSWGLTMYLRGIRSDRTLELEMGVMVSDSS